MVVLSTLVMNIKITTMPRNKKSSKLPAVRTESTSLLEILDIKAFGTKKDPCFGSQYDLSTNECKMCGDSELCCIKMAEHLGKTRSQMEKENQYKDMDAEVDLDGINKYIKTLTKKGKTKKEILVAVREKYELTVSESRAIYRKQQPKQ